MGEEGAKIAATLRHGVRGRPPGLPALRLLHAMYYLESTGQAFPFSKTEKA
jgi:hypothetical protein